ncbi:Hypothetical_protein [Hexamita inflata]|uniref:Hypothetical_protein n=1 Tax=Hexamita inflata TaxID=28002 RepID=A0AA86R875_9EUKA|nr:Hypothetical protein HINF_LOCUS60125 [Hexamita inflata]
MELLDLLVLAHFFVLFLAYHLLFQISYFTIRFLCCNFLQIGKVMFTQSTQAPSQPLKTSLFASTIWKSQRVGASQCSNCRQNDNIEAQSVVYSECGQVLLAELQLRRSFHDIDRVYSAAFWSVSRRGVDKKQTTRHTLT